MAQIPPSPRRTRSPTADPPIPSDILTLDGTHLEGGGQLLRLSLSLAALTRTPFRIHSIRGNRSGGGGLKAQHLACVEWLARACDARVEGAVKGSKEIIFVPAREGVGELSPVFRKVKVRTADGEGMREVYEAKLDIKTAGSTGLALQAILPFVLFTRFPSPLPVRIMLSGGTNVSQSPSFEYIKYVLLPTLERIGLPKMEIKLARRGWSQGGSSIGSFVLEIPPRENPVLPAFNLTPPIPAAGEVNAKPSNRPGRILHLRAIFIAPSACHAHFASSLKASLKSNFPQPRYPSFTENHGNLTVELEDSKHSKRMYCLLVATLTYSDNTNTNPVPSTDAVTATNEVFTLGRDQLHDRKLPTQASRSSHDAAAEEIADRVAADVAAEIGSAAGVDEHMRDQLVVFQALARGRSRIFSGWEKGGNGDGEGKGEEREASLHARTAEWVAEQMLGERGVGFDGKGGCRGVGFGGGDVGDEDEDDELNRRVEGLEMR